MNLQEKIDTMRLVMGKPIAPIKEDKEKSMFSKKFEKVFNKIHELKNSFNKKISTIKTFFKIKKENVISFLKLKKNRYEAFVIQNFHPEKTVRIRNQYLALKQNSESFSYFLERRGENKIYLELHKNKIYKKEKNIFKIILKFFKIFSKDKDANLYLNYLKSKYKKTSKETNGKNIGKKITDVKKEFVDFPSFSTKNKSKEIDIISIYQDLDKESSDWCIKLQEWESKKLQERKEISEKRGMSLVDFLMYKDRVAGKVVVG